MLRFNIIIGLIFILTDSFCQENLAVMIKDYQSSGCGILHKGDKIVVFRPYEQSDIWPCWTENGDWCNIDSSLFKIVRDKTIFKIKTNPVRLKSQACSQPVKENFDLINVDYCNIVDRIIKKDFKAFKEFIDLIPKVDAALSEIHSEDTWPVINSYTDSELNICVDLLDEKEKIMLIDYLDQEYVGYPISKFGEYLSLYYPKTWTKLKNFYNKSGANK